MTRPTDAELSAVSARLLTNGRISRPALVREYADRGWYATVAEREHVAARELASVRPPTLTAAPNTDRDIEIVDLPATPVPTEEPRTDEH